MTVDLATIGLEFRTDGMVKGRTELDRTAASANKAADAVDKTGKSAESADRGFSSWANTLKGLALGAIITQSIRTADALNQVNSRLSLVTKSTTELTQVQRQLFQLSQQNRSDFAATADLYTALARSTKDLRLTQEQLLQITGTFGKALIVSGGSAQSAQAAITQFNQAMASGVLRGEEFNSISEQAPRIMDLLASSLGKTRGELRQLAQDGKLTSDVVLPAILKGAKDVEAEFARMPVTVAQAGQVLQNSLGQAVLAIDNATGSTSTLSGAVVDLATILDSVTASMGAVNKETQKAGILQNGLAVVFETVAVLAANTAFVLKGIGNELGAIGAQVGAVLRGDFAQAAEIGRLAKLDAEAARAQIDATTRNILNARQRAQDLKDVAGITDAQSRRMAVLNDTIKAGTKATSDNTKAKKAKREESVKVADAIRDEERAMFALLEGEEKYRRLQDSRIEAADEMLRSIEFETQLLTLNTQERAVATAQRELERKGIVAGTEAYDEYIQKIRQAVINREATQESVDRIKEINDEGKRFAADLERGLTDSLFRAFEAGRGFFSTLWDGIKNLFKTTVLKLVIQGVVGSVGAGVTGLAQAAGGTGSASGALGALQNLNTAQGLAQAATGFSSSVSTLTSFFGAGSTAGAAAGSLAYANLVGSIGGDALGAFIAANGSFGGVAAGGAAAAGAGTAAAGGAAAGGAAAGTGSLYASAAAAGPYVVAALAVLNAIGVFRSKKIVDGGLQGELGGQVNDYALQRRGGTLFSGPSYRVLDQGVSAQNQALQDSYSAIRDTVAGMAEQLGLGNDAIKAFTVQLGSDLIHPDTGGFGIKTQGLTQDEIIAKIEAALVSANDQLAAFALGTEEYTREGETASQTLARLVGALNTVNGVFDALGLALIDVSKAAPDAAQQFIDLFGGAEQFATVANSYYQNFYTESERTAATVEGLRQRFFELGTAGATTREGFRALVEEQQRLHGATSPVVAELLKLESTFASVVPAIDAVTQAAAQQAEQAKQQAAAINAERTDRLRIERETAQAAKAAADELAKLNEQNFRLAISAGDVSAALAARGNTGPRFADFQGANGFNAAGYNLASIFSQQRSAQDVLAETRRQNPFEVSDFFGVVRELENTIASLQDNIDSGEFNGGVSANEAAAQQAFGDFLSPEQIQAAADGLTSFSNVLSLVTGTAAAGATGADQALRVLEGAYTGAAKNSQEYARGLEIIGNSVGVFSGNLSEIQTAIKAGLDYFASGEYQQAISQEALRQQVDFTSNAFRNLTARAASFNTETGNLETSFDVLDGFIGRLKSVQDAFSNAAGDRAAEAGLISSAAERIASIITTPVAEAARSVLADLPSFADFDGAKLRDLSLLLKDLGQFDNAGLEKTFIRVSDALASGVVTGGQYADLLTYIEGVYLNTANNQVAAQESVAAAAERARQAVLEANALAFGDLERSIAAERSLIDEQVRAQIEAIGAVKDANQLAYNAEIDRINGVRDAQREALAAQLDAATDNVSAIRAIYSDLNNALGQVAAQSSAATLALQNQARDYLRSAIQGSAAGVRLTQFTGLGGALDTLGNQSPELFRTFDDFLAAQDESVDLIQQLRGNAESQISVAEMTLSAINANIAAVEMTAKLQTDAAKALLDQQIIDADLQIKTLNEFRDAQNTRLDALLKAGRDALSIADGTFRATLGVTDAVTALQSSLTASLSLVQLSSQAQFLTLQEQINSLASFEAAAPEPSVAPLSPVAPVFGVSSAPSASGSNDALVATLIAEVAGLKVELQAIKTNTSKTSAILSTALGSDGTQPLLTEVTT